MKKRIQKWIGILLAVLLIITVFPVNGTTTYAAAAKPTISMTSKTLIGVGTAFTLSVKNLDKTKVKTTVWSSTNKNVVTVNSKTGYVTSKGKGTATVKCKITYKNGTVLSPSCKVTVKIPASAIKITNTMPEGMNNFVLTVGNTMDFDSMITPSNASDLITYTIDNTSYATVDKKGIVTALKPGIVRLTATASMTKAGTATSTVKDDVSILIVAKTAGVSSAVLTDATTLTVNFDNPVNPSTVIGTYGELLDSVTINGMNDKDGKPADKLGYLSGVLSSDGRTLTITSANAFNGTYALHVSNTVLSMDGTPVTEYYKNLELKDTKPPFFKDYKIDDTGMIVTLNFNKAMDFTNMQVSKVSLVKSNETADVATLSLLKTKTNYVKSEDSKSLTIDLTNINPNDLNKSFAVVFSGLKDKAGNYPSNSIITAYVVTDTTPKPQAVLKSLTRTGYYTITASFTRSIKAPGEIMLSNGKMIDGVVSKDDKTLVNYTLDATSAKLTGSQKVSIGFWDSYNVKDTDHTGDTFTDRMVNFTVSTTGPQLRSYKLTTEGTDANLSYILTLTYDKAVVLSSDTGKFVSRLNTVNGDIYSQKNLTYTATAKDMIVTLKLDKNQFNDNGTYTITIPDGFVKDNFNNDSKKTDAIVNRTGTNGTGLPAPDRIEQSSSDPGVILISFPNKLDKATAENRANYTILGVTILKAELVDNNAAGATVQLTLNQGAVSVTATYVIKIKGIKGYGDSFTPMDDYETTLLLMENKAPSITKIAYSYPTTINITFDDTLTGTPDFSAMQNGIDYAGSSFINGDTVTIVLNQVPVRGVNMIINPNINNSITDISGNKAIVTTRYITPTY
ncbi:Ig-like domain-containing protein [Anaerocolumna sp. AGMB13025]|uniref:Ig-like domain-containing protein n=1 Tax=Anaerocolumna sp. AGMB13025 TaxID=3039116 RepID=UPI00241F7C25|nr:Ig-like domain-containing protein [Anaerocolumna sp. AGMB13025]WFR56214.1 Ig-like domain-containing protein [Anaerocolumna sp. AGMB13025]